jgi:adenosylcobinamide-GDP ribazoletransferase
VVLSALAGAVAFLTTLPVRAHEKRWEAFRRRPAVVPLVGYLVGILVALPLLVAPTDVLGGFGFVLAIALLTGINHVDALTDLADGLAVHGTEAERVAAMRDSALGVGGLLVGVLALLGLFASGDALAGHGRAAIGLVVAAEVAAKLAMLWLLATGTPRHEGLGSALAEFATRRSVAVGIALALPAIALTWPSPAGSLALASGVGVAVAMRRLAASRLGGISGDVVGATNEVARLVALLAGVVAWTLW